MLAIIFVAAQLIGISLAEAESTAGPVPDVPPPQLEQKSSVGRITLVAGQTLSGIASGWLIGSSTPGGTVTGIIAGSAGGALGFGLSFGLTPHGFELSHSLALMVGPLFGIAEGNFIASLSLRHNSLALGIGEVAGTGLAELLWQLLRPSETQVLTIASTGLWLWGAGQSLAMATPLFAQPAAGAAIILLTAPVGLAVGSVLAWLAPLSGPRILIANAAWLMGLAIDYLILQATGPVYTRTENPVTPLVAGLALIPVATATLGIVFTRGVDLPPLFAVSPSLVPTLSGGIAPGMAGAF